jgi:hypothetical protein
MPDSGLVQISLFKALFLVDWSLKDLFPFHFNQAGHGKSLPLTVAGQQWFFTIFPS